MRKVHREKIAETLCCMRKLFERKRGWIRGWTRKPMTAEDGGYAYCLLGGAAHCLGGKFTSTDIPAYMIDALWEALPVSAQSRGARESDNHYGRTALRRSDIMSYNDAEKRDKRQILALVDRAYKQATS